MNSRKLYKIAEIKDMHPAKLLIFLTAQGATFEEIWPEVAPKWLEILEIPQETEQENQFERERADKPEETSASGADVDESASNKHGSTFELEDEEDGSGEEKPLEKAEKS